MHLTREEERMLGGYYGEAVQLAMKLVVRVGEALGAEKLVPITHAHASGISYDNIGEPGLRFIKRLAEAGGRTRVYATYNPAGVSIGFDTPLNRDRELLAKQLELIKSLEAMGFRRSATCIPYWMRRPRRGEHLAWGESSAVAVANTLYGARSNREGGPLALAAALTGRTYYWGLHIDENRRPSVLVELGELPQGEPWSGLAGYIIGTRLGDKVPYVSSTRKLGEREVVSMCAAAAAGGSTAMCIVSRVSPEDRGPPKEPEEKLSITMKELLQAREELSTAALDEAELFFTGCPHHEPQILDRLEKLVEKHGAPRRPVWVAVPASSNLPRERLAKLAKKNIIVAPGTCLVVSRIHGIARVVATDSVKTAFYLPRRHGVRIALASLEEFIKDTGEAAW